MRIRDVVHKGLCRFMEEDNISGIQPAVIQKIHRIVSFLQDVPREKARQTVAKSVGPMARFGKLCSASLLIAAS
jgi:hypothetical protein